MKFGTKQSQKAFKKRTLFYNQLSRWFFFAASHNLFFSFGNHLCNQVEQLNQQKVRSYGWLNRHELKFQFFMDYLTVQEVLYHMVQ